MTVAYTSGKNIASKSIPDTYPSYQAKEVYVRPADWLALPTISTTDQKFAGLVAVTDDESNFVSVVCQTSTGNFLVDWGDGTTDTVANGAQIDHTYTYSSLPAGTTTTRGYRQAVVVITPVTGNLTLVDLNRRIATVAHTMTTKWLDIVVGSPYLSTLTISPAVKNVQLLMLESFEVKSTASSFNSFGSNFRELYALQKFVFPQTMPISANLFNGMFYNDYSLYDVSDIPVITYTLPAVTMADMFNGCRSLRVAPWMDTSKVSSTAGMFGNCAALQVVPKYDTSNVTNMASMFAFCYAIESVPSFNTSLVTNMDSMFSNCQALVVAPVLDTQNVTAMPSMFGSCLSLKSVPWMNTSKVVSTGFSSMFLNCSSLETIPLYDTGNVTSMSSTFNGCKALKTIPLLNTSNVNDTSSMFANCFGLTEIPLLDLGNVTSAASMFGSCYALKEIPLFNTIKNTSGTGMFTNCYSLETIPLINTSNATATTSMFSGCGSLKEIPLLNLANNINTTNMFNGCVSLTTTPNLDLTKTTAVTAMFNNCYNLNNTPNYNMANVTTGASGMYAGCQSLASVLPTGLKATISFTTCNMSKNSLETMMNSLGSPAAAQTLTISSNYGADTGASTAVTAGQVAGITTINVTSSTAFVVGQWVVNTVAFGAIACTFQDAGDTVTKTSHGLANGTRVSFPNLGVTTGIVVNTIYYVVNRTTDTFQVALTPGGAVLPLTTNGSGTMKYEVYCTGKPTATSITVSAPTTATTTATAITCRQINTYLALLKNWAVTG